MSAALYPWSAVRFWNADEIEQREAFQARAASTVARTLRDMNPAWRIERVEGPILTPENLINDAYAENDIFRTDDDRAGRRIVLRAETTASSYAMARHIGGKLPLCVWQAGKSFRTERNDGASATKLRFNEFWQQEFQCIYRADSKADYRHELVNVLGAQIRRFVGLDVRVSESDRLPSYSQSTLDIEVLWNDVWKEVASCSIRTDYAPDVLVCEIAIGLCRIVEISQ